MADLTLLYGSSLHLYLSCRLSDTLEIKKRMCRKGKKVIYLLLKHNILFWEAGWCSRRRIAHWPHAIDHRCWKLCWLLSFSLPSVSPSAFLPLYVSISHLLQFFSPPSFCLPQALHFSSPPICHFSPYPLFLHLFVYTRCPFASPPPPPLSECP